jgi:hypothetical protein
MGQPRMYLKIGILEHKLPSLLEVQLRRDVLEILVQTTNQGGKIEGLPSVAFAGDGGVRKFGRYSRFSAPWVIAITIWAIFSNIRVKKWSNTLKSKTRMDGSALKSSSKVP